MGLLTTGVPVEQQENLADEQVLVGPFDVIDDFDEDDEESLDRPVANANCGGIWINPDTDAQEACNDLVFLRRLAYIRQLRGVSPSLPYILGSNVLIQRRTHE